MRGAQLMLLGAHFLEGLQCVNNWHWCYTTVWDSLKSTRFSSSSELSQLTFCGGFFLIYRVALCLVITLLGFWVLSYCFFLSLFKVWLEEKSCVLRLSCLVGLGRLLGVGLLNIKIAEWSSSCGDLSEGFSVEPDWKLSDCLFSEFRKNSAISDLS